MNAREGLRAAMAEVNAYYKQRGIFQVRFGFGQRPASSCLRCRRSMS